MKHVLFCLLVFGLNQHVELKAQDSIKRTYLGIELAYINPSVYNDGFFPSFTLSKGKHMFSAGPALMYHSDQVRPMWGGLVGYRLYPNGNRNRFNLFFDYTSSLVKGKFEDGFTSYVWEGNNRRRGNRTSNLLYQDNYFGFGFQLNVLKNLYVTTIAGVNIGFYKEEYTYTYDDGSTWKAQGKMAFRQLNSLGFFKIGLGYKFALPK